MIHNTSDTVQNWLTYATASNFHMSEYLEFKFKLNDFLKANSIRRTTFKAVLADPYKASIEFSLTSDQIGTIFSLHGISRYHKDTADRLFNEYHGRKA